MSAPARTLARPRASRFERLASWSQRRHLWAVALWVIALAAVTAASQAAGSAYHNDFSLPGTESQQALDTLQKHAPLQAGAAVQIVMQDPGGMRAPHTRERVTAMLGQVRHLPHVAGVHSPYADRAAISRDGTIAYATVTLDGQAQDIPGTDVRTIIHTAQDAVGDGLRVELGGDAVRGAEQDPGGTAEGVGMLAALVVLVLLFGSLLAASLPIVIAVFAVGSAVGLVILASHAATVADYTVPLMILVGLGVGIDYALLLFSRYRGELLRGADRQQAGRTALDTAGRTVLFAGCTVIIALLGLIALGLGSLQGVAIAVAVTVLVTLLGALTLLPALLAIMGRRIERAVLRRAARGRRADGARWARWSDLVQRRPWPMLVAAGAVLLALSAPVLGMRLGFADAGNDARSTTSRQAYDLLAEGFGPGFSSPLIVVADGGRLTAGLMHHALASTTGVAAVTPPAVSPDGKIATVIAFPGSTPQDLATQDLVTRLRTTVLPPLAHETGARILVGGTTAATVDFANAVANRLPLFIAVVIGLSALLLLLVFRSLLIPVKAALLNVLSVGAALGVITLVFQHGVLGGAAGIEPGPIEAFVPVMIFAIAFGLWHRGTPALQAVPAPIPPATTRWRIPGLGPCEEPVMSLTRRDVLRLTGGAVPSIVTLPRPFTIPLPVPSVLRPARSDATTDYYEVTEKLGEAEILPGHTTKIWGYCVTFPWPMLETRSRGSAGQAISLRQAAVTADIPRPHQRRLPIHGHRHRRDRRPDRRCARRPDRATRHHDCRRTRHPCRHVLRYPIAESQVARSL